MSHLPERKEKDCLNCGAIVQGRFCHVCGQENKEPKESFWHLVTHFTYDITHFDGKFFSTLRYLLFRPGFLSDEYLRGRRADYLHPIRMYVFTSAFFFLIFFTFNKESEEKENEIATKPTAASLIKQLENDRNALTAGLTDSMPVFSRKMIQMSIASKDSDLALIRKDTTAKDKLRTLKKEPAIIIFDNGRDSLYTSLNSYDSIQNTLPPAERDNFIMRKFVIQYIHLKQKYNRDSKGAWAAILEKFKHYFPQMLFVSLPLFALFLQMLYARRKNYYYVNHVIFTIHLYCGTFIIILLGWGFVSLLKAMSSAHFAVGWLNNLFVLAGFYFWYKSMRNFYEQRRGKTILKYFLALTMGLIIMGFLFALFFFFSAMTI